MVAGCLEQKSFVLSIMIRQVLKDTAEISEG